MEGCPTIMPPQTTTNRPAHRYRPFYQRLTLHSTFQLERQFCPLHSLYTIHPTDSDITAFYPPQPLSQQEPEPSAKSYFVTLVDKNPFEPVPKPPGEVGRPGGSRKGYRLLAAVKWPVEVYKEVQMTIHRLATDDLPVVTFPHQDDKNLDAFYVKINEVYPYLRKYKDNWVTADFLRMFLKNRVQAAKKEPLHT